MLHKLENREGVMIGCFALALVAGIIVLTVSAANAPRPDEEASALAISGPKAQVIAFAGGPPQRCVYAAPDREICTWRLEGSLIEPGAAPGEKGTGVNLVCELPLGADAQGESHCDAHARELAPDLPPVSAAPESSEAHSSVPVAELSDALTLGAISHRLGDAPDACLTGRGTQTCSWRVSAVTASREIAGSVASLPGDAYRLRCELPIDGSDRSLGSCTVAPLR